MLRMLPRVLRSVLLNNLVFVRNCQRFTAALDNENHRQSKNQLYIYDSFSKTKEAVLIDENPVNTGDSHGRIAKIYVCGPTVYDYCHLGHALTYIRVDLFTRLLFAYFGIDAITAMGITDIDDKIINKANQEGKSHKEVSDYYYNAFLDDISLLNIQKPSIFLRVTNHIDDIISYIKKLQETNFAYRSSETNDINFDSSTFPLFCETEVTEKSIGKLKPSDFALWKHAKPNEPSWTYVHDGYSINGRPGWHVECSVVGSKVFGSQIDFHFGGKDLKFPHHHNEALCCSAYHQLPNPYQWSRFWLHCGHLVFADEKMSKSLGNVITIRQFLKEHDASLLRLFCIRHHYRWDTVYDEQLIEETKAIRYKLYDFQSFLREKLITALPTQSNNCDDVVVSLVEDTEHEIKEGLADDLDINRGLEALLRLIKIFKTFNNYSMFQILLVNKLLTKWMSSVGLSEESGLSDAKSEIIINKCLQFRENIRCSLLRNSDNKKELLKYCDELRNDLRNYGIIISDKPLKGH